jgi:hypothetical protein
MPVYYLFGLFDAIDGVAARFTHTSSVRVGLILLPMWFHSEQRPLFIILLFSSQ